MQRMTPPPPVAGRLQAALAGTLAGSLGVLAPLWEGCDGAALLRLQGLLALALPHVAGLNPAGFGCDCLSMSLRHIMGMSLFDCASRRRAVPVLQAVKSACTQRGLCMWHLRSVRRSSSAQH